MQSQRAQNPHPSRHRGTRRSAGNRRGTVGGFLTCQGGRGLGLQLCRLWLRPVLRIRGWDGQSTGGVENLLSTHGCRGCQTGKELEPWFADARHGKITLE